MTKTTEKKLKILIAEDDLLSRLSLKARLESMGEVVDVGSKQEAIEVILKTKFDLAFIDLDLEAPLAGLMIVETLSKLKLEDQNKCHVVVLSGREDDGVVLKAYQLGCDDYLSKPFTKFSIELVFKKYYSQLNQDQTLQKLKNIFHTEDQSLIKELETIEQALLGTRPILITGASGTGKTFLAKFVHQLIGAKIPFVHLNCAEISESLIESELFGYEKGAFTGALKHKKGMLELADGGILFLDEIATMPLTIQKKLLKAIEEKSFYPLGSEKVVHSEFRLISATCEDLKQKIAAGEFRADFFFRIDGFNVHLKSLSQRKEDLNNLIHFFVKKGERLIIFDPSAKMLMANYSWPGNVRELERTIEVLQTKKQGIVTADDLSFLLGRSSKEESFYDLTEVKKIGLTAYIENIEKNILSQVLKENNDKVRKTMIDLKIANNAFYRILERAKGAGEECIND